MKRAVKSIQQQWIGAVLGSAALFVALGGPAQAGGLVEGAATITGGDIVDGSIASADITDGSITSADIKNDTVTGNDIAASSVRSSDIGDGAVTGRDIATGAVGSADIATGGVTSADIATGAVGATKLAATPAFSGGLASNADVANNTAGIVGLTVERFDVTSAVTLTSGAFTVPVTGTYVVVGAADWAMCEVGTLTVAIAVNETVVSDEDRPCTGSPVEQSIPSILRLSSGQSVTLVVQQTSGAPLALQSSGTSLSLAWIAP